mmetsp:Transcript_4804/g.5930  ORF Transcript_4804/g.5930 Transcript_4804/m.5930 type:complete len:223 (+) Transcript_4804:176-844(+)
MNVHLGDGGEDACVIWMHGLGDTPHGWADMARKLRPKLKNIKWVLPCAPEEPVTCNSGYSSTSWMDIIEIPIGVHSPDNGVGQEKSVKIVKELVEKELQQGIPSDRIVIGGFSQGGAMALASTLNMDKPLAGCVVFSGWALPKQELAKKLKESVNRNIPYLICHGTADNVVLPENGKFCFNMLKEANEKATLKLYEDVAHSSCPEEMNDLETFLRETLPPKC